MPRLQRKSIVSIVVAIAVVVGVCALGVQYTGVGYGFSFCLAPADQRNMISRFEDEPFYSIAPANAVLIEENATTYYCHHGRGGSPLGPSFANVQRSYRTSGHLSIDELHRLADQSATAAGWRVISESETDQGPGRYPAVAVTYCKDFGGRVGFAAVWSRGREFEVTLDARDEGETCASVSA